MSMWKDNTATRPAPIPEPVRVDTPPKPQYTAVPAPTPVPVPHADAGLPRKESLIAAEITIEGKIEGSGSVRIAGKFKGDVNVQGDLTIEAGAKLTGSARASKVTIAGELEGNVEEASLVDLLQTGGVVGDIKAGPLTVAAGARIRGQTDCGWSDGKGPKAARQGNGHAAETRTSS